MMLVVVKSVHLGVSDRADPTTGPPAAAALAHVAMRRKEASCDDGSSPDEGVQ